MRRLRRSLGPIAATWILWQAATLGLAKVAFGFDAMAVTLIECTCGHGTGHTDCPMHHKSGPSRPGLCQVECADDADHAILGSLLGQTGLVLPPSAAVLPSASAATAASANVTTHVLRPAPPDPPPPRA